MLKTVAQLFFFGFFDEYKVKNNKKQHLFEKSNNSDNLHYSSTVCGQYVYFPGLIMTSSVKSVINVYRSVLGVFRPFSQSSSSQVLVAF